MRRYAVRLCHARRARFASLGVHLDWHTPSLDLHFGPFVLTAGRWRDERGRFFSYEWIDTYGHTDQCRHRLGDERHGWEPDAISHIGPAVSEPRVQVDHLDGLDVQIEVHQYGGPTEEADHG